MGTVVNRWSLLGALALTLASGVSLASGQDRSEEAVVVGEDDRTLQRSREILSNPESVVDPAFVESIRARPEGADVEGIANQGAELARGAVAEQADELASVLSPEDRRSEDASKIRFRIFVTQSMSDEELRALGELTVRRQDTVMVLRGLLPGQDVMDLHKRLQRVFGGSLEEGVFSGLELDPPSFSDLGVQQAPAIAMYDDEGQPVGWATGVTDPDWLAGQLSGGVTGFRGQNGPVVELAEEDLIERMQRNAREYDWAAARSRAEARFFSTNVPSHSFPEADVARVRQVDPSFVVDETVTLPDGQVLVPAGTRINPLEMMPFSEVIVVFDPGKPAQLNVVHEVIRRNPGRTVKVLASSLASVGNFEGYGSLMNRVGRRVYMLPDALREQFRIERVPSVVSVEGTTFRVEEIPPSQFSAMEGAP